MAQPVRVLQVVTYMGRGGLETMLMNYYRHIDRDRVQFDFLVDADSTFVPREEIESLGGRVFVIPPYQHVVAYQGELVRLFRQERWPIVHSHVNSLSVFPLRAAKRAGVPVRIAHSHSTAGKGELARNAVKDVLRPLSNVYPTHRIACTSENRSAVLPNEASLFSIHLRFCSTKSLITASETEYGAFTITPPSLTVMTTVRRADLSVLYCSMVICVPQNRCAPQ